MHTAEYSLKNILGNILFIGYISLCIVLLILNTPYKFGEEWLVYIMGELVGFSFKIIIIIVFWKTIMKRYIEENNKLNIIKILVGALIIMLALSPIVHFSSSFIESYIVISMVYILKNDYHIFVNSNSNIN